MNRRELLRAFAAVGLAGPAALRAQVEERPRFARDPFTLGVASGYPTPTGVVLWTRLAPFPDAPGGGLAPTLVPVHWEVARDEGFRDLAARGMLHASPDWAHAVHAEPQGLEPARWYWYRFRAGDAISPVGRTRTAPAAGAMPERLRICVGACQHYEQGWYGAWRHAVADTPDLMLHLGDYIYESSWGRDPVRSHGSPEPHTLEDYRARHALYRGDADLAAAHAAAPWLVVWDDHEVDNDYANDLSQNDEPRAWFLARRAAAYRAYYEHMPLPRRMVPFGAHMQIYTRVAFGQLALFHMLDNRQYRSPQACPRPGRAGSNVVETTECAALADPRRTLLGLEQERWLDAGFAGARARWNVLGQQTLIAQFDQQPGPGRRAWTDGWDGYPEARRRLLDALVERRVSNPVALGGDIHAFSVTQLKRDFDDPGSPAVASEFVCGSITSLGWPQASIDRLLPENPHVLLHDSRRRGYLRMDFTPERALADLRAMDSVTRRDADCRTLASFVVEQGRPGPQRA